MQLEETMVGVAADKAALVHDYLVEDSDDNFALVLDSLVRLPHQDLLDFGQLAELLGFDRKLNTLDHPVSPRGSGSSGASLPDAQARDPGHRARPGAARRNLGNRRLGPGGRGRRGDVGPRRYARACDACRR